MSGLIGLVGLLVCWNVSAASMGRENALRDHPVPYLALHGEDPIHWQEWGPAVMAAAQRDNRIVLLSIGYFSCHWCHVMQRESFRHEAIADLANQHFIFVKVDKEMHPVLDHAMMSFAQSLLGRAGWPLNVFLTPDGLPIHALLYVPPDQFLQVLERLQVLWSDNESELRQLVDQFPWQTTSLSSGPVEEKAIKRLLNSARTRILAQGDLFQGGFGVQNKFPSVPQLAFLLAAQQAAPDDVTQEFLVTTLDAMAHLGLRDHLAGGFFRYTVDPGWEIPHFEKMLYDNALLANLYLEAGRMWGREDYLSVARETLDFLQRDMWKDGALVSSLSAVDDRQIEGGAYLWSPDEVRRVLTEDEFRVADAVWGVSQPTELEAGNHLRQFRTLPEAAHFLALEVTEVTRLLARSRARLFVARSQRIVPVDDKRVSGWNGLALSAFARAARHLSEPRYADTAATLQRFLQDRVMAVAEDGTLSLARAEVHGSPRGRGSLEDYAYVAQGFHDWAELTGDKADYVQAAQVAQAGWAANVEGTGWRSSPELVRTLPDVVPLLADGPTPSPSAVMLQVSHQLARRLGDRGWSESLHRVRQWGFDEVTRDPFQYATQLIVLMQEWSVPSD